MKNSWLGYFICLLIFPLAAQTPCDEGKAGEYPCHNIDLLKHVAPDELGAEIHDGVYLNDIWGWTDSESGREFALVGMTNGTSFVEVTNPLAPRIIGMLPEHEAAIANGREAHDGEPGDAGQEAKSLWRDIKTYQHYAFIVSEDPIHGIQVFDLNQLLESYESFQVFGESAHYDGVGNAHNIVINEATGYAYAVGATRGTECSAGGLHIVDIRNPLEPIFAGCFDDDGYTHDAQVVIYNGPDEDYQGREIAFNSNENTVTIVDITDKSQMKLISRNGYDKASYTHQGWLTEDHRYFISNDELDEYYNRVSYTTTYIWDVSDLDIPTLVSTYTHPRKTIDHNLYVRGKKIYQSNYTSGLIILDASLIDNQGILKEQAYFDTYTANNNILFRGSWSNYPYFQSGIVVMTDMTEGLFILQPHLEVTILSDFSDLDVCEGSAVSFELETIGGVAGYEWQIDRGEGFESIMTNDTILDQLTDVLAIPNVTLTMDGSHFRGKVIDEFGKIYYSNAFELKVTSIPKPDFRWEINENQVTLINLTDGDAQLSWQLGYDELVEELSTVVVHEYPSRSESYDVTLTASNECGTSSKTYTIELTILGIEAGPFTIYPNPVSDVLEIDYPQNWKQVKVSILTMEGKEILTSEKTRINVNHLNPGVYILRVTSDQGNWQQKVVVK